MLRNADSALVTLGQTATSKLTVVTQATEAFGGSAANRRRLWFDDFHEGQRITCQQALA